MYDLESGLGTCRILVTFPVNNFATVPELCRPTFPCDGIKVLVKCTTISLWQRSPVNGQERSRHTDLADEGRLRLYRPQSPKGALPERAHRALDALSELWAIFAVSMSSLVIRPSP